MSGTGPDRAAEPRGGPPPWFVLHWLARPAVWLGGAVSAMMIVTTFAITIYAIVMRYFLNAPLLWADEVTGWMLVALVWFGAAEAYRHGDHIAIDVLSSRARGPVKELIEIVSDLAVFGFAVVLGVSTWDAIVFAKDFGSYTDGNIEIETWILQVPILVGAVLMGVLGLLRLVDRLIRRVMA